MTYGGRSSSAERLGLFVGLLGLVGILLGIAYIPSEALERRLVDERFRMRAHPPEGHPDLVLVALDEKYAARRGNPSVTPRDYLTRVIRTLSRSDVRVIALDIALMESDTLDPGLAELRSALETAPSAVLPSVLSVHGSRAGGPPLFDLAAEPATSLRTIAPSGFVTFVDGTRPRMRLLARLEDGSLVTSFALRAVQSHLGLLEPAPATWRREGGSIRISEDAANLVLEELGLPAVTGTADAIPAAGPINFVGPIDLGGDIAYLSSEDLLSLYEFSPTLGQAALSGKLAVVGAMHAAAEDRGFASPWGAMHGVELQVNILNSLLTRTFLRDWSGTGVSVLLALIGLLCAAGGALTFMRARSKALAFLVGPLLALGFPLVLTVAAFAAFDAPRGTLLPMAGPLKVWLFGSIAAFSLAAYRGRWGTSRGAAPAVAESTALCASESPLPPRDRIRELRGSAVEPRPDPPRQGRPAVEPSARSKGVLALIASSIVLVLVSIRKARYGDD